MSKSSIKKLLQSTIFYSIFAFSPYSQAIEKHPLTFGAIELELLEYRTGDSEQWVWEGDAYYGTDNWKLRLKTEGEYSTSHNEFETLENQLLLQKMISTFWDAKLGIRYDSPEDTNTTYAVIGVTGLAPQWIELDADVFLAEGGDLSSRVDLEYDLLLTNYLNLRTSAELNAAFYNNKDQEVASGLTDLELGLRLSYDLYYRQVSPYIGIHWETALGNTADLRKDKGEETDEFWFVIGTRLFF